MLSGYLVPSFYPLVQLMRAHKSAAEVKPPLPPFPPIRPLCWRWHDPNLRRGLIKPPNWVRSAEVWLVMGQL